MFPDCRHPRFWYFDAIVPADVVRDKGFCSTPNLPDHITLTPIQITDLLNFVLRSTYFKYNGTLRTTRRRGVPTVAYDSHHPQSVKCGIVKCYPPAFLQKVAKTKNPAATREKHQNLRPLLCYHTSKEFRKPFLEQHGICTVFKCNTTLTA